MKESNRDYSMRVVCRDYIPVDCGFCSFYVLTNHWTVSDNIPKTKRWCALNKKDIRFGAGDGRCEVSDFLKYLLEVI